ncbi:SIR2 family protein [Arthrobacter sp. yr096]|uniref:SIR2 family protein n=1 Tax=Arthrobacter sp. yr096 TaxID=1761750 RepID=UPI0015A714F2|nr:SIR2 family protein [Arthrobacter sp. yr096]
MFSAIRLLSSRLEHEASPFLSSWLPGVEAFDSHPVSSRDEEITRVLSRALMGTSGFGSVTGYVTDIVRDLRKPGDGSVYRELERELLPRVCKVLADHHDVSYLRPLASLAKQQQGLDIATLNYDLTVESMCEQVGASVQTGIAAWSPGSPLVFKGHDMADIRLLKLHGSINWSYEEQVPGSAEFSPSAGPQSEVLERFIRTRSVKTTDPTTNRNPAIVIGDREKLGGGGPTLALMREFEASLDRANRLVVVGYSFADGHINAVIRNWINTGKDRTITVLDPFWPSSPTGFQADLVAGLVADQGRHRPTVPPKMNVIKKSAASGLHEALSEGPTAGPDTNVSLSIIDKDESYLTLEVRNAGPDIHGISLNSVTVAGNREQTVVGFRAPRSGADYDQRIELGHLSRGSVAQVEVQSISGPNHGRSELTLICYASLGQRQHLFELDWTTSEVSLRPPFGR